LLYTKDDSVKY